jgi:hypothetical protein
MGPELKMRDDVVSSELFRCHDFEFPTLARHSRESGNPVTTAFVKFANSGITGLPGQAGQ